MKSKPKQTKVAPATLKIATLRAQLVVANRRARNAERELRALREIVPVARMACESWGDHVATIQRLRRMLAALPGRP